MKTITELKWKPDFAKTIERFDAWWHGEVLDRPPVTFSVKPSRPVRKPVSKHATLRERWLDAEFVVERAIAGMEATDYVGDNFPVFSPNIGPEITATLFGCDLDFGEFTSWSHPVVHEPDDWQRVIQAPPNFDNPYWQAMEKLTALAIERCADRYIVGLTDLHGTYDILAGLRDPQMLCLDVVDCPDVLQQVSRHVAQGYVAAFERNYEQVATAGFGSTTWTPLYHRGAAYVPSCDFWCMVSPQIARDLILPTIRAEMQPLERSVFHLDGPNALQHLDLVLELPGLNAVQWVYGDGHGRGSDWLDVYRRCLAAGKSVQIFVKDKEDALYCLHELGPKGVWIDFLHGATGGTSFANVAEANAFLGEVERASKTSA